MSGPYPFDRPHWEGRLHMADTTDALSIYLNDHLGGANAGIELARQARAAPASISTWPR
ncbi:hypothetical protein HBB16_11230 [Pseudonocardia sp. MCCB 268]|nr:hypothetical protein [Pseudonocardia cytotoxica]